MNITNEIIQACAVTAAVTTIIIGLLTWFISNLLFSSKTSSLKTQAEELDKQLELEKIRSNKLEQNLQESGRLKIEAETKLSETIKNFEEQKALLEDAKVKLSDTFKSLAADALASNDERFLILAEAKFKALKDGAEVDLDSRKKAIEDLVNPLGAAVKAYQEETTKLEVKRSGELSALGQQLTTLGSTQKSLQDETAKLVNALKSSTVRGRWGEIALRRIAELSGMSEHIDFIEQETAEAEDGDLRPDMIVTLPAKKKIIVDSKVSLAGYLEALEATTEKEREEGLEKHKKLVNSRVKELSSKEYWSEFDGSLEFVVLFIPNDSFLAAAAERDPDLIENALKKKVVIATPTTLVALLKAVFYGWRQEALAENAKHISDLGQELVDRINSFMDHFAEMGKHLGKSVESYNSAISSYDKRVLPTARKFKKLGVNSKNEIKELAAIEQNAKQINSESNGMVAIDE